MATAFAETPPRVHSPNTGGVGANGGRFGPVEATSAAPESRTFFGLELRAWQSARASGAETYPAAFSGIPIPLTARRHKARRPMSPGPTSSRPAGPGSNVPPRRSQQQVVATGTTVATVAELVPNAQERAALTDGSCGFFGARLRLYQRARDQKFAAYDDPFSGLPIPVSVVAADRTNSYAGVGMYAASTPSPAPEKPLRIPRKAPAFGHAFGYTASTMGTSPGAVRAVSPGRGGDGRSMSPSASDAVLFGSTPPMGASSVPDDALLRVSSSQSRSTTIYPAADGVTMAGGGGGGADDDDLLQPDGFVSDDAFSDMSSSFYDELEDGRTDDDVQLIGQDEQTAVTVASLAAAAVAGLPPAP